MLKKRIALLGLAALSLVALTTGPTARPAQASNSGGKLGDRCPGAMPTVRIPFHGNVGHGFTLHGRSVSLRQNGAVDHTFVQIEDAHRGDKIWMDVSTDGGRHWYKCGPFTVRWGFGTRHSPVMVDSGYGGDHTLVRACANIKGDTRCGKWYDDHDA